MGAPEVAKKALKFADEFGLSHDSYKEFHPLIIYYSKQARGSPRLNWFACLDSQAASRRPLPLWGGCARNGRWAGGLLPLSAFRVHLRVQAGQRPLLRSSAVFCFVLPGHPPAHPCNHPSIHGLCFKLLAPARLGPS